MLNAPRLHPKRCVGRWLAVHGTAWSAKLPAMCGIVGIVGSRANRATVELMAQCLRHRGPDGEGIWEAPGVALGHLRLAIQDLSPAGNQPMLSGSLALTYNGEIYNHEALRQGLSGPWHSTGDTETLLHLLAARGPSGLDAVAGMFAFALWDDARRRLVLARDRVGMKPLYYRLLSDGIAFASELKALLALGKPPVDRSAVRDFLCHGYVPAPKTIFEGVA